MNWRNTAVLVAALGAGFSGPLAAQALDSLKLEPQGAATDAKPITQSSRLVTFRYSPSVSFTIRALENTFVNIEVPEGETIQGLYLSDATQWSYHITGDNRRALIKPSAAGLVNTGTLVTTARSYELTMMSVSMGEPWFQRVQWTVPNKTDSASNGLYWRGQMVTNGASEPASVPGGAGDIDPTSLRFSYKIKGRADFAPSAVFDDGVRTWFRFDKVQDIPAIFALRDGQLEVADFAVQGAYVVVPTLAERFILRLRNTEVSVERQK